MKFTPLLFAITLSLVACHRHGSSRGTNPPGPGGATTPAGGTQTPGTAAPLPVYSTSTRLSPAEDVSLPLTGTPNAASRFLDLNPGKQESFLKFDVRPYAKAMAGATVKLQFWYLHKSDQAAYGFNASASDDDSWQADTLTWAQRPAPGGVSVAVNVSALPELERKPIEVGPSTNRVTYTAIRKEMDISALVKSFSAADDTLTLALSQSAAAEPLTILSADAAGYKPSLLIDFKYTLDPAKPEMLGFALASHPRVWATTDDFERVKTLRKSDATLAARYEKIKTDGDRILAEPANAFLAEAAGREDLWISRAVLRRTQILALLFLVEGDSRYADALWAMLQEAAKDDPQTWKTSHFLDVAEMSFAYAIAYDWLHAHWSEEQKRFLRNTLWKKGLEPGLASYGGEQDGWWANAVGNWNMVCNGGLGASAMAIGHDDPNLAFQMDEILSSAMRGIEKKLLPSLAPDGGWLEGPNYFAYMNQYFTAFYRTAEKALGTDFGMSTRPGVDQGGFFALYMQSPTEKAFNFSDANEASTAAGELYFLAEKFNVPAFASFVNQTHKIWNTEVAHVLFYTTPTAASALPLDRDFTNIQTASLRSSWADASASFLAFSGGDNAAPHGDLDAGNFVFDALGGRWVFDYGFDDYGQANYFNTDPLVSPNRWSYFRKRAEAHNTLVLNPGSMPDQEPTASSAITTFRPEATDPLAIVDLTSAYATYASSAKRGFKLFSSRKNLLVQDEVEFKNAGNSLFWFLQVKNETRTEGSRTYTSTVTLEDGNRSALLTQEIDRFPNGVREKVTIKMVAKILAPASAVFAIGPAGPLPTSPQPAGQNPNTSFRRLQIQLTGIPQGKQDVAVVFLPFEANETEPNPTLTLTPLSAW